MFKIIDLHQDFHIRLYNYVMIGYNEEINQKDLKKIKETFNTIFAVIFPYYYEGDFLNNKYSVMPSNFLFETFRQLNNYKEFISKNKEYFEEFKSLEESNKVKFLFLIEGLEINNIFEFETVIENGIKAFSPTWALDNKVASGNSTKKDYGLTKLGEEVINLALDRKILIDLSHSSDKTALDVLDIVDKPIIIGHTNLRKFTNSKRDISDEVLEKLIENKGVFGLMFSKGEDLLLKEVEFMDKNYSLDYVAIGSDWYGIHNKKLTYPGENYEIRKFLDKLLENYSKKEVKKIAFKNVERILKKY